MILALLLSFVFVILDIGTAVVFFFYDIGIAVVFVFVILDIGTAVVFFFYDTGIVVVFVFVILDIGTAVVFFFYDIGIAVVFVLFVEVLRTRNSDALLMGFPFLCSPCTVLPLFCCIAIIIRIKSKHIKGQDAIY